jgi:recombination associated protein RdgC
MFRNIRMFRLASDWPESEEGLDRKLEQATFKPCGSYTEESAGFEPPGGEGEALARRVGGADLLRLRVQTRVLPAAAINEALEERIRGFQERTQREPTRREKRDLKDEVHAELTPKALLKSQRIWGCVLLKESVLAVDTSSEAQAELFVDTLRRALGSFQVTPLAFKQPVSQLLTQVFLGSGPPNFVPGRECKMLDPSVGRASVSWQDIDLRDTAVQKHVRDGLQIDRLAMQFDETASLVLDQDGVVRKLKLEGLMDEDAELDEHPLAQLDAQFVVTAAVMAKLLTALKRQLGGYG